MSKLMCNCYSIKINSLQGSLLHRKVESRPDSPFKEGKKKAKSSANAVEEDDGQVPSRSIRGINVHKRIWPPPSNPRAVNSPLQEAVCCAPEDEVADAEPRKPKAIERKFNEEENQIDRMHINVHEAMVKIRGQKHRDEQPPVHQVREHCSRQDRLEYTLCHVPLHSRTFLYLP